MRNIKKLFTGKIFYVFAVVGLQAFMILYGINWLATVFPPLNYALTGASAIMAFWLLNKYENPSYKIIWILIITLVPICGVLLYVFFGNKAAKRSVFKKLRKRIYKGGKIMLDYQKEAFENLENSSENAARQAQYIYNVTGMPVYEGTKTKYLSCGEEYFDCIKAELLKSEKFIYLDYFIISDGKMWREIFEILKQKAAAGVEIKIMYDDAGSNLNGKFIKMLEEHGIECKVFNPLVPVLSVKHNNRDHRKICIIDGNVAFTGGINISDEYINAVSPLGHWLDMGIMLEGKAVESFSEMFLTTWNFLSEKYDKYDFPRANFCADGKGFAAPYQSNPFINGDAGANIYINMISRAKKYIYIATPYLILDFAMEQALMTAARSGVDVRIFFPGIPDKKIAYILATKHFENMIPAGVRIFIYEKGFMHGKLFLSDDEYGIVSTINMDFRSLYLHFEDGVWMYKTDCLGEMKKDFEKNFDEGRLILEEDLKKIPFFWRLVRTLFKPFAPLM